MSRSSACRKREFGSGAGAGAAGAGEPSAFPSQFSIAGVRAAGRGKGRAAKALGTRLATRRSACGLRERKRSCVAERKERTNGTGVTK